MKRELAGKRILVIGQVWPESKSSAAGKRMLQLLHCFQQWDMEIYFGSPAHLSPYSDDLSSYNVKTIDLWLNDKRTDEILKQLQPDVVMYDRFMIEEQFGWRVTEQCPNAFTILDTEDLHFLRYARQELIKKGKGTLDDFLYSDRSKREIAAILRSDLTLLISSIELNLLVNTFNVDTELLIVIPFMEETMEANQSNNWLSFEEREGFVFIGNFIHEPNYQTVLKLKKEIWPLLRKALPDAKMHIYGAYPSQKVIQLNNEKERFIVHGRAENALEVIEKSRVMLAPIPFGAGIKGKFIDAIHSGTPSISSSIGAESMQGDVQWPGYISDELEDLIAKAKELYTDKAIWQNKQSNGLKLLQEKYNAEKYNTELYNLITTRLKGLKQFRQQHFLGEIMRHHNAQSTKYMALWIEEKNKKSE